MSALTFFFFFDAWSFSDSDSGLITSGVCVCVLRVCSCEWSVCVGYSRRLDGFNPKCQSGSVTVDKLMRWLDCADLTIDTSFVTHRQRQLSDRRDPASTTTAINSHRISFVGNQIGVLHATARTRYVSATHLHIRFSNQVRLTVTSVGMRQLEYAHHWIHWLIWMLAHGPRGVRQPRPVSGCATRFVPLRRCRPSDGRIILSSLGCLRVELRNRSGSATRSVGPSCVTQCPSGKFILVSPGWWSSWVQQPSLGCGWPVAGLRLRNPAGWGWRWRWRWARTSSCENGNSFNWVAGRPAHLHIGFGRPPRPLASLSSVFTRGIGTEIPGNKVRRRRRRRRRRRVGMASAPHGPMGFGNRRPATGGWLKWDGEEGEINRMENGERELDEILFE